MAHKISKNTNITNTFSIVYSCSCWLRLRLLLLLQFPYTNIYGHTPFAHPHYVTYIFSVSAFNLLLGVFFFRFWFSLLLLLPPPRFHSVFFFSFCRTYKHFFFFFSQVPISLLFYCLIRLTCLKQITWIDGLGNVLTTGIDYMKEPLPDSRRITAKSILKLTPKKEHHNTTFTCQAQNTADRTYRSAKLHLEVSV